MTIHKYMTPEQMGEHVYQEAVKAALNLGLSEKDMLKFMLTIIHNCSGHKAKP